MDKTPPMPPHHRPYPRARPTPVRAGAAPRPGERTGTTTGAAGWSRAVPEGRRFPRGG